MMHRRNPDHQEQPILREAAALGEVYVCAEPGTTRDWLVKQCVRNGWLTAHGRDPSRYLITPQGAEVAR